MVPQSLKSFSREDYYSSIKREKGDISKDAMDYSLRKALSEGRIVRTGWNRYVMSGEKKVYSHEYSGFSEELAEDIASTFPEVLFQVFELTQLNSFMNHLIGRNTIFVSVENGVESLLFDRLWQRYEGRVMLKPGYEQYSRYYVDDLIVVGRLPSESPKGFDAPWQIRLERILVDLATDRLLGRIVPESEKDNVFLNAFDGYLVDVDTMVRYAKRKGADKKIQDIIDRYMPEMNGGLK